MVMSRTTKSQNWSWSRIFTVEEMTGTQARRAALDSARADWEAAATASGYSLKKGTTVLEGIAPLWRKTDGGWTEVAQGDRPAEGYKVTITGPMA